MLTASSSSDSFSPASTFLRFINGHSGFRRSLELGFLMDLVFLPSFRGLSLIFPTAKLITAIIRDSTREPDLVQLSCSEKRQMKYGVKPIMLA